VTDVTRSSARCLRLFNSHRRKEVTGAATVSCREERIASTRVKGR